MADIAEHKGIITKITDETVSVTIEQVSACGSCHARTLCSMSDKTDKIIDVERTRIKTEPHLGDEVTVVASADKGLLAVVLAYIVPAIIAVAAVAIALSIGSNELVASIVALALVAAYYGVLYLMRQKLNKKFVFTIKD